MSDHPLPPCIFCGAPAHAYYGEDRTPKCGDCAVMQRTTPWEAYNPERTVDNRKVALELRDLIRGHAPDVRLLGNMRADTMLGAIDGLLVLSERYTVLRAKGCAPAVSVAGVLLGTEPVVDGADLDAFADRYRATVPQLRPCPPGFWCVHEVLCSGARR